MIRFDAVATLFVDDSTECSLERGGELLHQVDGEVILTLGVEDLILGTVGGDEEALITDLPPHFCIEGSLREHYLIEGRILLLHLTVAKDLGRALQRVVAYEVYSRAFADDLPVTGVDGSGIACTLLLLLHGLIEACFIDAQSLLRQDQGRQV